MFWNSAFSNKHNPRLFVSTPCCDLKRKSQCDHPEVVAEDQYHDISFYSPPLSLRTNIWIKHVFSLFNIRQVPWEGPEGRGFQHLPSDLANVYAWKTMFGRYYCIKTENICYISHYFLHDFVSPNFHRCLANLISIYYARSRAGQYTSRITAANMWPWYYDIESCVAVH